MRRPPIALIVSLLLASIASLRAQNPLIEPADRVVSSVNVREQPSSSSALIGQFRKGEQAVLLLDVPGWYRVRLPSGLEGFVSKAWTHRVAVPEPPTPLAAGDIPYVMHFLDVGTGDAAIIDIGDREIIIDGGNSPTVLRNYINDRNIIDGPVERVVVTHGDTDHWRRLNRLMNFDGNGPHPPKVLEFWDPGYDRLCNPPSDGGRQNYLAFINDWARHALRVNEVIDNQVCSLRVRQVIGALEAKERAGTYRGIRTNIAAYHTPDALPAPVEKTILLAQVKTRLKRLDAVVQERLINWGYAVCDAALRKWVDTTLPAPGGFPYPASGLG